VNSTLFEFRSGKICNSRPGARFVVRTAPPVLRVVPRGFNFLIGGRTDAVNRWVPVKGNEEAAGMRSGTMLNF
jgi:hypothetical protein